MLFNHSVLPRRSWLALFLLLNGLAAGILCAQDEFPRKHLDITGSERLRIIYDSSFIWPDNDGASAVMDLPVPPDTGSQHVESFHSNFGGRVEKDGASPPHRLLVATLHPSGSEGRRVHWRVEITGVFQTRQLVDGPPTDSTEPVVAPRAGDFLGSTESINWRSDAFQDWLDSTGLRRAQNETPVAFGQRLYTYLREHGRYIYPPSTAWNAAACCQRLRTDCGGFSLVFTAACRANRIPARLLVGQFLKARQSPEGRVELTGGRQAHVIAEFFDPQIGWIPEDISSTFLRTPGYANLDFFGRDPGYFFAWHVDTDFHFNTPRKADAHVQWIQNPNLWFSENADEANDSVSHHWEIEKF